MNTNNLIDQIEIFIREIQAGVQAASRDEFHRKIIIQGLKGEFKQAGVFVNQAIESMHTNHIHIQKSLFNSEIGKIGSGLLTTVPAGKAPHCCASERAAAAKGRFKPN